MRSECWYWQRWSVLHLKSNLTETIHSDDTYCWRSVLTLYWRPAQRAPTFAFSTAAEAQANKEPQRPSCPTLHSLSLGFTFDFKFRILSCCSAPVPFESFVSPVFFLHIAAGSPWGSHCSGLATWATWALSCGGRIAGMPVLSWLCHRSVAEGLLVAYAGVEGLYSG